MESCQTKRLPGCNGSGPNGDSHGHGQSHHRRCWPACGPTTDAPRCHGGPTRPTPGVLVYTIFVLEMLVRLRHLGFVTNLYQLQAPWRGIFGPNAIVFEAIKLT